MADTGAGLLVDVMRANHIDHVFGVPGGHLLKKLSMIPEVLKRR